VGLCYSTLFMSIRVVLWIYGSHILNISVSFHIYIGGGLSHWTYWSLEHIGLFSYVYRFRSRMMNIY